jgi:serine/threonine protein kinase
MYSCGVILYFLLSGRVPFDGTTQTEISEQIRYGKIDWTDEVWKSVSCEAKQMITALMNANPALRPSAFEAESLPWLQPDAARQTTKSDVKEKCTAHQISIETSKPLVHSPPLPWGELTRIGDKHECLSVVKLLSNQFSIGRSRGMLGSCQKVARYLSDIFKGNSLELHDIRISANHCTIVRGDTGVIRVTDHSTNGIYINGVKVSESAQLQDGYAIFCERV